MTFPRVRELVERGDLTLHGSYFGVATGQLRSRSEERRIRGGRGRFHRAVTAPFSSEIDVACLTSRRSLHPASSRYSTTRRPAGETEFEHWFQTEHLAERIAVPGFLLGRRYEALSGPLRYFNYYLTQSADVLKSEAYLTRLDNPTPMTRLVMSEIFKDMNRTVFHRTFQLGAMRGAAAVVVRFDERQDEARLRSAIQNMLWEKNAACGEVWIAADWNQFPVSEEERLRGGDHKIEACLLIETLRVPDAEAIAATLASLFRAERSQPIGCFARLNRRELYQHALPQSCDRGRVGRNHAAFFLALISLRLIRHSAICTALSAAPLRRLSETTHSARPLSTVGSVRMRLM